MQRFVPLAGGLVGGLLLGSSSSVSLVILCHHSLPLAYLSARACGLPLMNSPGVEESIGLVASAGPTQLAYSR
jgi:hypothetical protein